MKKSKKKNYVIKFIIFIFMIVLFILFGTKDYQQKIEDNVRFASEYKDISKNNIYKYINENQALEILNGKSGVIFIGFSSNIWSHYYADYLNEMAMLNDISEIYYYDFKRDRSLKNSTYHAIVKKLTDYLALSDLDTMDISAPTIVMVLDGEIIFYNNEISDLKGNIKPEDYFTEYNKNMFKAKLDLALKEYKSGEVK